MLKIPLPRSNTDAVSRGARWAAFDAEATGRALDGPALDGQKPEARPLTRAEASVLSKRLATLSPWFVVAAQAVVGVLAMLATGWVSGERSMALSALYGAATVVVPGALMARRVTSRLNSNPPVAGAMSVIAWGGIRMVVAVAMLLIAPRMVDHLSWPVMLVTMVVCMQSYLFALSWRGRPGT